LIRAQEELVVGTDMHNEVFRHSLQMDELPEIQNNRVSLRCIRSSNPLRAPQTFSCFGRKLRACASAAQYRQHKDAISKGLPGPPPTSTRSNLPGVADRYSAREPHFSRSFFHFAPHGFLGFLVRLRACRHAIQSACRHRQDEFLH